MPANHKSIVRRLVEEVWNKGKLGVADRLIAVNYSGHDAKSSEHDLLAFKEYVTSHRKAFPDLRFTVDDLRGHSNTVVFRWTARGTHRGKLMDIRPTHRQMTCSGITIFRFSRGKIVEGWMNWDAISLIVLSWTLVR
jgi:predicted ester cyclase